MKVKLLSKCNVKAHEGDAGDVITFKDKKLAERIIAGKGGVEVKDEKKPEDKD